eukprot:gene19425-29935_t
MDRQPYMERKKPRTEMSADTDASPEKLELVQRIKSFQRGGAHNKAAWGDFCQLHTDGTRDPLKLSIEVLCDACDTLHIPEDI